MQRKISLIQNDLVHLSELGKFSLNEIASDFVKQAAVERMLERIINRAIDINSHIIKEASNPGIASPKDYTETFLTLARLGVYSEELGISIAKSVGTRNVLVHEYDEVDNKKIYSSIDDCLRDYHAYIENLLKFLER